jgi:HAD superfamily hydrolase (TIGR01509 family)
MTLPRRLSAVVFDMDGTLHDTEGVYHASLKQAVHALGFTITDAFCHSMIGMPGPVCDAMLCDHLGPGFPFADFDRLYGDFIDSALRAAVPLKPGAAELLDALGQHGLKKAVATSARRHAAELHLGRSGLRAHLPIVVTRDDVARGKPYPDLFLRAAELLDVAPDECLAVEDSLNGIRAAHAAGMMPIMVPDLLTPTDEISAMCLRVLLDLHEVRALVAEHLGAIDDLAVHDTEPGSSVEVSR